MECDCCGQEVKKPTFHKKYRDPIIGGLLVGEVGAVKYILDETTEEPITGEYHSFWMYKGTLMGSIGSREERITHI